MPRKSIIDTSYRRIPLDIRVLLGERMSPTYRDPFSITGFFSPERYCAVSNQSVVIAIGILTRREDPSLTLAIARRRNDISAALYKAPNYIRRRGPRRIYARIELQLSVWQRWFSLHCNGIYSMPEIPIFQIDLQIELRRASLLIDMQRRSLQVCARFLDCRQAV